MMHPETLTPITTIAYMALPVASAVVLIIKKKSHLSWWLMSWMISSIVCFLLLWGYLVWLDGYYESNLNAFDLDGDGSFSGAELTPEMDKAMEEYTSDTGRSFGRIANFVISPMYAGFWHVVIGIPYLLNTKKRQSEAAGEATGE